MTAKWNLIVDVAECHNCNNCFIACKDEHVGNDFPGYAAPQPLHGHKWIEIKSRERGTAPLADMAYVPTMCNHCDNAPCVKAGQGAVKKRDDGIVIIDPQKARGRKDLVETCPYGAIWWNEELQLPQHWIFDAHLLDQGWSEPRAAQSCPTGAIKAVKIEDTAMQTRAEAEGLRPLKPELGTAPRVYYKNLHRYDTLFVAGIVLGQRDGITDCVAGAEITLSLGGKTVGQATTDPFGEFKLDRLPPQSGPYTLAIAAPGCVPHTRQVTLADRCAVMADIVLQPAG